MNREPKTLSVKPRPSVQGTLFIVGPTASGKSGLAMRIAKQYGGEIICADSQTIRRDLDIGTAKPTRADREEVVHHMLDIIDPYERYSAAEFKRAAQKAIQEVLSRGKLPIVVGGTGLYIDALLYDFEFRQINSGHSREELEGMSTEELQVMIKNEHLLMPENSGNSRHLIRTIESKGQPSRKGKLQENTIVVGVDAGKEALLERVKKRIKNMLDDGFLQELDDVIKKYGNSPYSFDAIIYKIAQDCRGDNGDYDVEEIKRRVIVSDMKYAKRQRTWFKRNSDIVWFEQPSDAYDYLNNTL